MEVYNEANQWMVVWRKFNRQINPQQQVIVVLGEAPKASDKLMETVLIENLSSFYVKTSELLHRPTSVIAAR